LTNGGLSLARSSSEVGFAAKPVGKVCQAFWQRGGFIKDDEPQGNQVIYQMNDSIPEVIEAMRTCVKEDRCVQAFRC
jgi:hypothetical protein